MRTTTAALLSAAIFVVSTLLLAGCVTTTADGIQLQPGASTGGNPAAALGVDPATYVILDLERSGGLAGVAERARLHLDGHVLLERQGSAPVTFQLSPTEQAQLTAALDAADFYRNAAQSEPPADTAPDALQYRVQRRGVLLQGVVQTQDGSVPAWLEPVLPLLTNLLLAPDPARVQPYTPPVAGAAPTAAPTPAAEAPAAPAITLLEFARSQGGHAVRVLVNLDRTYSVARAGAIEEGVLTRDEMAALVQLLEAAQLRARAGDYTSGEPCTDCVRYEVTYRNLLGGATVRGEEGVQPEWLQVLTDTLVDALIGTEAVAALPSPAATQPAATATTPATAVPTATPASPTPTPTPAAPTVESPYTTADLLADLAAQGARVEALPGSISKPYLAAPGVAVQVNGQLVQVFQYADAAALAADVAGLAPNASSIDGRPLIWSAAPHFWRKGGVLALAVSNDQALVELVSRVMGPAFAGR
jgi:hypothetical protein